MKKVQRQSKSLVLGGGDSAPSSHSGSAVPSPASVALEDEQREEKRPVFKSLKWTGKSASKKKNLKQILAHEKAQQWPSGSIQYGSIDAPPSFHPAKKYSDVLGLPAKYTDPQTRLQFTSAAEFQCIRSLPNDIVQAYLILRNAQRPM